MILQADNVSASRGGKVILDGINTAFMRGRTSLILGRNGSGKSTLLKVLSGLLPYCAGNVYLDAVPLEKYSRRELAKRCAVLLQEPSAPPDMTEF